MLAGLQSSQMQLFQRDAHGTVVVTRNETDIVGWSVDEILRGFLGVEQPTAVETARTKRRPEKTGAAARARRPSRSQ
jgi:hypothetical protein